MVVAMAGTVPGCFFQADKAKTLVIGFGGFILGIDE